MRSLLSILLLLPSSLLFAQSGLGRIDTLYYDKDWKGTSPFLAEYYRVALYPENPNERKLFKDYYISGQLQGRGGFRVIDPTNDKNTIFDGMVESFYKNGNTKIRATYKNGVLEGDYNNYSESGKILISAHYHFGMLSGLYTTFNNDGSTVQMEYREGEPLYDYYTLTDTNGNVTKFRISDNYPLLDSPSITERTVEYYDGVPWQVYRKNGFAIALTNTTVRDYGKWHRADIIIRNSSIIPIEFIPELSISAHSIDKNGVVSILEVWPCEKYLKKVKRAQTWASIAVGISEGLAAGAAGYSTSTTTAYNPYTGTSTSYTTTTYNAGAAYHAQALSQQRIASLNETLGEERYIKELGYLKRNTINPGDTIKGYVNIQRIKGETVSIIIDLFGAKYEFDWSY